jgi:predicted lipid-binding transport protein (Tim44 family)
VVEGGLDRDIADNVDPDGRAGKAFAAMKRIESDFSVTEFSGGARQAYEMILMAFEGDDLETLKGFLSSDVYDSFESVITERQSKGLKVDANFIGVRELKVADAMFDEANNEAEITMKFVGEITSCVKNAEGEVIEGDPAVIKRQKDVWTFARIMGSDDPNWELVATGE